MEKSFDEDSHATVLIADDIDEVASRGIVAGDGFVLEHLACEADSGDGSLNFVGHIVDEVGLHLVEFALVEDGPDREEEEGRNEDNHADAEDGVEIGIAGEDDG